MVAASEHEAGSASYVVIAIPGLNSQSQDPGLRNL